MHAGQPDPAPEPISLRECVSHYEKLDQDKDGIADWSANIDGRLSVILYPADEDMDGDGTENLFDPAPLNPKISDPKLSSDGIPEHLLLEAGEKRRLQSALYRRFKILAIDHTDEHSLGVLKAMLTLLDAGLPEKTLQSMGGLRVLYAFKGHDPYVNIAAYHRTAKALSIGGESSYGDGELTLDRMRRVLATLSHEIGHAFLFENVTVDELRNVGSKYGKWKTDEDPTIQNDGFYSKVFFKPHPLLKSARLGKKSDSEGQEFISREKWKELNITSEYAMTNLHEWFADAFAAMVMQRLGPKGHLGSEWRTHLARLPSKRGGYWVNYNNLSKDFKGWIDAKLTDLRSSPKDQ